ncbi:hypothetical protein LTR66_010995 [Elasticomyces elasticus]|nr:hypothetical protein LTR66_010995 [Elasticomyces elasticus]
MIVIREQHLDKGHAGTEVEGLTKSENLSKRGHGDVHVGMPKSSSVSAATHLETILTNPLLSRIPSKSVVAVSPDGASLSSSKEPQRTLIDAFEDVAAQGAATVETAAYALQTIKRQLSKLPADAVKPEAMRLGAAAKVLLWLRSSGQIDALDAKQDADLITTLVYLLHMEDQDQAVWIWIRSAVDNIKTQLPVRSRLLYALVRAQLQDRGHAQGDAAIRSFLYAHRMKSNSLAGSSLNKLSLRPAGWAISQKLSEPSDEQTDPSLVNMFLSTLPSWDKHAAFNAAAINLCHPSSPSSAPALKILQQLKQNPKAIQLVPAVRTGETMLIRLAINTAGLLLKEGSHDDAAWILEFVKERLDGNIQGADRKKVTTATTIGHSEPSETESPASFHALRTLLAT